MAAMAYAEVDPKEAGLEPDFGEMGLETLEPAETHAGELGLEPAGPAGPAEADPGEPGLEPAGTGSVDVMQGRHNSIISEGLLTLDSSQHNSFTDSSGLPHMPASLRVSSKKRHGASEIFANLFSRKNSHTEKVTHRHSFSNSFKNDRHSFSNSFKSDRQHSQKNSLSSRVEHQASLHSSKASNEHQDTHSAMALEPGQDLESSSTPQRVSFAPVKRSQLARYGSAPSQLIELALQSHAAPHQQQTGGLGSRAAKFISAISGPIQHLGVRPSLQVDGHATSHLLHEHGTVHHENGAQERWQSMDIAEDGRHQFVSRTSTKSLRLWPSVRDAVYGASKTSVRDSRPDLSRPSTHSMADIRSSMSQARGGGDRRSVDMSWILRPSLDIGAFRSGTKEQLEAPTGPRPSRARRASAWLVDQAKSLLNLPRPEDLLPDPEPEAPVAPSFYTSLDQFQPLLHKLHRDTELTAWYACCAVSGEHFILKHFHKAKMNAHTEIYIRRAIDLGGQLAHDNLLQLRGMWEDDESIYMIENYASKGDAFQDSTNHPEKYTEEFVCEEIATPLLHLLVYLHTAGVVHRGIVSENVMFGRDGVVLGHLISMVDMNKERPKSPIRQLDYCPPEVLLIHNRQQDFVSLMTTPTSRRVTHNEETSRKEVFNDEWDVPRLLSITEDVIQRKASRFEERRLSNYEDNPQPIARPASVVEENRRKTLESGGDGAGLWDMERLKGDDLSKDVETGAAEAAGVEREDSTHIVPSRSEAPRTYTTRLPTPGDFKSRTPPSRRGTMNEHSMRAASTGQRSLGGSSTPAPPGRQNTTDEESMRTLMNNRKETSEDTTHLTRCGTMNEENIKAEASNRKEGCNDVTPALPTRQGATNEEKLCTAVSGQGLSGETNLLSRPATQETINNEDTRAAVSSGRVSANVDTVKQPPTRRGTMNEERMQAAATGKRGFANEDTKRQLPTRRATMNEGVMRAAANGRRASANEDTIKRQLPTRRGTMNEGMMRAAATGRRVSVNEDTKKQPPIRRGTMTEDMMRAAANNRRLQAAEDATSNSHGRRTTMNDDQVNPGSNAPTGLLQRMKSYVLGEVPATPKPELHHTNSRVGFLHTLSSKYRAFGTSNAILAHSDSRRDRQGSGLSYGADEPAVDPDLHTGWWTDYQEDSYDEKADTWMLGCLVYELLVGQGPFEVEDKDLTAALIISSDIVKFPPKLSTNCQDFIRKALTKEPALRPSAAELLDHPWITQKFFTQDGCVDETNTPGHEERTGSIWRQKVHTIFSELLLFGAARHTRQRRGSQHRSLSAVAPEPEP